MAVRQQIMTRRMNHNFLPSTVEALLGKCAICRRPEIDHTDRATCDHCSCSGVEMFLWLDILLCAECVEKQNQAQQRIVETADQRVAAARLIEQSRKIDNSITVFTEIFNAKTVAIHELWKAIEGDPSIPANEKHFKLASVLDERYQHLKDILFSKRKELGELESEQRAIQVYYNDLAKSLREHEREKLRLKDNTYIVQEPKVVKQPKTVTVKKPYDKALIKTTAAKYGLPEAALQMICVAKNITPEEAAQRLLQAGKDAKG